LQGHGFDVVTGVVFNIFAVDAGVAVGQGFAAYAGFDAELVAGKVGIAVIGLAPVNFTCFWAIFKVPSNLLIA
jgi:hypothetical protein